MAMLSAKDLALISIYPRLDSPFAVGIRVASQYRHEPVGIVALMFDYMFSSPGLAATFADSLLHKTLGGDNDYGFRYSDAERDPDDEPFEGVLVEVLDLPDGENAANVDEQAFICLSAKVLRAYVMFAEGQKRDYASGDDWQEFRQMVTDAESLCRTGRHDQAAAPEL